MLATCTRCSRSLRRSTMISTSRCEPMSQSVSAIVCTLALAHCRCAQRASGDSEPHLFLFSARRCRSSRWGRTTRRPPSSPRARLARFALSRQRAESRNLRCRMRVPQPHARHSCWRRHRCRGGRATHLPNTHPYLSTLPSFARFLPTSSPHSVTCPGACPRDGQGLHK